MIANAVVFLSLAYIQVGLVFAIFFLTRGIHRIDANAKGASVAFRLIILPGVVALWPVLLKRWISGG